MTNTFNIPILLITFKRCDKLERVLKIVNLINPRKIYVFSDFHSEDVVQKQVLNVRSLVENNISKDKLITYYSSVNMGCKFGPETAISWFFEHEEQGIILEEDCLPGMDFFKFAQELLLKYRHDENVMQINGTNLISHITSSCQFSYYFSNVTSAWGWATWRRAWEKYPKTIVDYEFFYMKSDDQIKRRLLDKRVRRLRKSEVESVLYHGMDAWDFTWRYFVNCSGLAITPKNNLIQNIGFDIEATHTFEYSAMDVKQIENINYPLTHPPLYYEDSYDVYFYKLLYPFIFQNKVLNYMKQLLVRLYSKLLALKS
jgi:hypothetical protein